MYRYHTEHPLPWKQIRGNVLRPNCTQDKQAIKELYHSFQQYRYIAVSANLIPVSHATSSMRFLCPRSEGNTASQH
jgi:hypothetical protein